MLRVGVSTLGEVADSPRVWSGTPAGIVGGMRRSDAFDTVLLAPPSPRLYTAGRAISALTKRLPGAHKLMWEAEALFPRRLGADMAQAARATGEFDWLLAIGWEPIVAKDRPAPVAYWGDGTYAQRLDASPHWSGLGGHSRRTLERTERAVFESLDLVVMASQWAAQDVVRRYGIDAARVHVVPLGANIATPPRPAPKQVGTPLRLLASGVEWQRKGMDIAVQTADALRARGHDVVLDVIGTTPPDASWHRDHVRFRGFLSKADPAQAQEILDLYAQAHVFLFPTRDDPYGVVLCESAAFGLPVVAPRLSAIPEIVDDGVTGSLVPIGAEASAYAAAVEQLVADEARYTRMSVASRDAFEARLNWDAAVSRLAAVVSSI